MRGRGERELLDELQVRSVARAAGRAPGGAAEEAAIRVREGVPAREAFAAAASRQPLPAPPPAVAEPGRPPVLSGGSDPAPGLDVVALEFLAADAAVRAQRLLAEALAPATPRPCCRPRSHPGRTRCGWPPPGPLPVSPTASPRAVRAWGHGGPGGLAVLEEEWTPADEALARARASLAAAWEGEEGAPRLRAAGHRWTVVGADAQLRYGRDGRWWPYRKERGRWWPAGPPDHDPAAALAVLEAVPPPGLVAAPDGSATAEAVEAAGGTG
ncbi:hypothetical protein [Streptomyces sp. ME19-01-6]|uniref:hypothetical protein n=1 Tax=Streptomyces sp. ME19-01-6 TaxID=3028686 RepID=UPI0029CA5C97|nr:hypothetical protein [Streptomyces sp. ME19-01-6]